MEDRLFVYLHPSCSLSLPGWWCFINHLRQIKPCQDPFDRQKKKLIKSDSYGEKTLRKKSSMQFDLFVIMSLLHFSASELLISSAAWKLKHKDKYWLWVVHSDVSLCESLKKKKNLIFAHFLSVSVSDLWTANMAWSSANSRADNISSISPASTHYVKVSVGGYRSKQRSGPKNKRLPQKQNLLLAFFQVSIFL